MSKLMPVRVAAFVFVVGAALAQTSTNYDLEENSLNSGGNPADGVTASSASFQLRGQRPAHRARGVPRGAGAQA